MMVFVSNADPFISRLQTAQIPSPEPIMLRSHVLVMSFIGRDDMYVAIYLHHLHMHKYISATDQNMGVFQSFQQIPK